MATQLIQFDSNGNPKSVWDALPPENARAPVYMKFLERLQGEVGFWDRGKGFMSWVQGVVLLRAHPKNNKNVNKGDFDQITKPGRAGQRLAFTLLPRLVMCAGPAVHASLPADGLGR